MNTTENSPQIDFIKITKEVFERQLTTYFKEEGKRGEYYYNQSCAYSTLLLKFGVSLAEIDEIACRVRESSKK